MDIISILFLSFALAADAFAVALAAGAYLVKTTRRQRFRLSFHFGFFQFIMPIIGFFLGYSVERFIESIDHWIAFAALGYIGTKMIIEGAKKQSELIDKDITKGASLIILSVATSIDALAVGFALGVMNAQIFYPSVIIGIVAAGMTLIGMMLGEKISSKFGQKVIIIGGVILISIGIKILLDHLLA